MNEPINILLLDLAHHWSIMRASVNVIEELHDSLLKTIAPLVLELEHLTSLHERIRIYASKTNITLEMVFDQGTLKEAGFLDVLNDFISHHWLEV